MTVETPHKYIELTLIPFFGKEPPPDYSLTKEFATQLLAKKKEAMKNKLSARFSFMLKELHEDDQQCTLIQREAAQIRLKRLRNILEKRAVYLKRVE